MSNQQADSQDLPDDVEGEHEVTLNSTGTTLALPGQNLPDKVYIIPIHNRPFFPAQVLPVIVN